MSKKGWDNLSQPFLFYKKRALVVSAVANLVALQAATIHALLCGIYPLVKFHTHK